VINSRTTEIATPLTLQVYQTATDLSREGSVSTKIGKQVGNKVDIPVKFRAGPPTKLILKSVLDESALQVENNNSLPDLEFGCEDEWGNVSAPTTSDESDWCVVWNPTGCLFGLASQRVTVSGTGRALVPGLQVVADDEAVGVSGRQRIETFYLDVSGGRVFTEEGIVGLEERGVPAFTLEFFVLPTNAPTSVSVCILLSFQPTNSHLSCSVDRFYDLIWR
jgi:hypothetical protein